MKKKKRNQSKRIPMPKVFDLEIRIPMEILVCSSEPDFVHLHTAILFMNRNPLISDDLWAEIVKTHIQLGRYN